MIRLIYLTDYSEMYSHNLIRGIKSYARTHTPWDICRVPAAFKAQAGFERFLQSAVRWKADIVIGQFDAADEVGRFADLGIIAYAQDHRSLFTDIPNITGDYHQTGAAAAQFFLEKGFREFAFYGIRGHIWSEQRCKGFRDALAAAGNSAAFHAYEEDTSDGGWYFNTDQLPEWLRRLPRGTAILACDDKMANRLLDICRLNGIMVPDTLAILGVDNDEIISSLSEPRLSTISLDIVGAGTELARTVDEYLAHTPRRAGIVAAELPDIVVRHSAIIDRDSTDLSSCDDPHVKKVLDYIRNNLTADLSVKEFVKLVPMSRRLLEIRFKEATKQTIHQYCLNKRLNLFESLLLTSNDPIGVIAEASGLGNMKNLSRQFKARSGMTPGEFRQKLKPRD